MLYFIWIFFRVFLPSFFYNYFFPIEREGGALKITYYLGGQRRFFYLPPPKAPGGRAFLVKNGKKKEITQPGGYPLFVSANDLQGEEIIIENLEGEEERFSGDTLPYLFS